MAINNKPFAETGLATSGKYSLLSHTVSGGEPGLMAISLAYSLAAKISPLEKAGEGPTDSFEGYSILDDAIFRHVVRVIKDDEIMMTSREIDRQGDQCQQQVNDSRTRHPLFLCELSHSASAEVGT